MKFIKYETDKYNSPIRKRYYGIDILPALKILGKTDKTEEELKAIKSLIKTLKCICVVQLGIILGLLISVIFFLTREEPKPVFLMIAMIIGFILGFIGFVLSIWLNCQDYMEWVDRLQSENSKL